MSNEPMELAKNYDPKKTPYPALAQVKYDGVPLVFKRFKDGRTIMAYTRQNEIALSVSHLIQFVQPILNEMPDGACIVAECLVPGMSFKDSSGIIRRHTPDKRIVGVAFDGWLDSPDQPYIKRFERIRTAIIHRGMEWSSSAGSSMVSAPFSLVLDHGEAMDYFDKLQSMYKDKLEGMILHHADKPFQPGKRCWGMGRVKPQPTIDLEVVSYEEAVSEGGEPLGMVGRINVELTVSRAGKRSSSVIGVGPGKMSHDERRAVWQAAIPPRMGIDEDASIRYPAYVGRCGPIIEIKYMPDATYDALRQPTFQRFRQDKEFPDVLERN